MLPFRAENGVAILTAMMLLFLVSGLSLFVFQNAATDRQIAAYSVREYAALSVAESGIEQALSWFTDPSRLPQNSPKRSFFEKRFCQKTKEKPDFSDTLFLLNNRIDLRLYKSIHTEGICTVEAKAAGGKGVKVDLSRNPMTPITAAVQGIREGETVLTEWVKWGLLRAMGDPNLDTIKLDKLRPFIKRFGRYFVVSPFGHLEENGIDLGSFDQVFGKSNTHNLVFIDIQKGYSVAAPLQIEALAYKGYFYFSGDIHIVGKGVGRSVLAYPPPPPQDPLPKMLDDIHLDGFFYTPGKMVLDHPFRVYGAIYAQAGFAGKGANLLQVWYNDRFQSGSYEGVIPLIRIPGTWRTM